MLGHWTVRRAAAWAALLFALLLPLSVLAQDMTLTLNAQPGTFTGKWVYRSFSISSKPGDTLAKLALGLNELELTEQNGRITGKRLGQGVNYDLSGVAYYVARQGASIRLTGKATISGKVFNRVNPPITRIACFIPRMLMTARPAQKTIIRTARPGPSCTALHQRPT